MKSTYELIGGHWDRNPLPKVKPEFFDNKELVRRYDESYDLMDWKYFIRGIPLSDLLATVDMQAVEKILLNVNTCDAIIIDVDYFSVEGNGIVRDFLIKRLLQIYNTIMCHCRNTDVFIMADNRDVQKMIEQRYGTQGKKMSSS